MHHFSIEAVYEQLKSSKNGLTVQDASERLGRFGRNKIKSGKQKSKFAILVNQFTDLMILILIGAAVISFVLGEQTDAYVILAIVIINAWIGFSQEVKAEESIRMLQKMVAQYALVRRDNQVSKIEVSELVPGDIIHIEAGDIVPADARVILSNSLKTDEAALTGESHSVEKTNQTLKEEKLIPAERINMLFKGTIVSNGSGMAIVCATGMQTELGKIAQLLEQKSKQTPLQKRLDNFSKQLTVWVLVICLAVVGIGLVQGEALFVLFLLALSLAVAALPEALPAVVTIALAQGAKRMVKHNALVRKLPAVETLGSVTFICSDKTGTLTQNIMTVEKVKVQKDFEDFFNAALMLNNEVQKNEKGELLGDSTETALVEYVERNDLTKEQLGEQFPLIDKLPFDSVRMKMSTLHKYGEKYVLLSKGAPRKISDVLCAEEFKKSEELLEINRKWAAEGLRVLFFAYKIFDEKPANFNIELEKDLHFLGAVAMIDPPREEVLQAINECKSAGIKTVMITGDQVLTAQAIAKRLNIYNEGERILSGKELAEIDENELKQIVKEISVYARVSPEQKLKIVKALQEEGEYVAMTGDGVNDAPSLKQSNIGVAMGITGTDVSKEAAAMILLDDNFATIVKAVKEGRRIYANIKKFILYVLSCNLAEILTIVSAPLLGLAMPLLPIHILWINLVTDGLPGIALTAEAAEKNIMRQAPRPPEEQLFAGGMPARILIAAISMTILVLFAQNHAATLGYDIISQQSLVFTLLCFLQLLNALSVRFDAQSLFNKKIFSNFRMWLAIISTVALQIAIIGLPQLQSVFKTTALDAALFELITYCMGIYLAVLEMSKIYYRQREKKRLIVENKKVKSA